MRKISRKILSMLICITMLVSIPPTIIVMADDAPPDATSNTNIDNSDNAAVQGQVEVKILSSDVSQMKREKVIFMNGKSVMIVNGKAIKINSKDETITPVLKDNIVFVPSYLLSKAFSANIAYNQDKTIVTITIGKVKIQFSIVDKTATIDGGSPVKVEASVFFQQGTEFFPIEFIAKSIGQTMAYDKCGFTSISKTSNNFTTSDKDQKILQDIAYQIETLSNHAPYPKDPAEQYYFQNYFVDIDRNKVATGRVIGVDADGDSLKYTKDTEPKHGKATVKSDGRFTYTPIRDYIGLDEFYVKVDDSRGGTCNAIVRVYTGLGKDELMKIVKDKYSVKKHPRLIFNEDDFANMKINRTTDTFLDKTLNNIISTANGILPTKPETAFVRGVSRGPVEQRTINLALAYRLTSDKKYLDRLIQEINAVCDENIYTSWGPVGGGEIDMGPILQGISLAFDWCYDDLSPELKLKICNAFMRNAYIPEYGHVMSNTERFSGFNNYAGIGSAGFALSALAICDEAFSGQEMVQNILPKAMRGVTRVMVSFFPDGAYYEGIGYGGWMMRNMATFISAQRKCLGLDTDAELAKYFYKSAEWANFLQGGAGNFQSGEDAPAGGINALPITLMLADKANRPDYAWLYYKLSEAKGGDWGALLFYNPEIRKKVKKPEVQDVYFRDIEQVYIHSDFGNVNENFMGMNVGSNVEWHTALEIGTVQLQSMGTPWFLHMGGDSYKLPNYGGKTFVYRKRAEGRNTLVFNPNAGNDQIQGHERFEKFESTPTGSFAIGNLTFAYSNNAFEVKRGIQMFDNKSQFLIQDEIKARGKSEIYSFFHTGQKITMNEDGKSATLKDENGNILFVKLITESPNARLIQMEAKQLPTSPQTAGQNPNIGYSKLAVHLTNTRDTTIALWCVPLLKGQELQDSPPAIKPLSQWTKEDMTKVTVRPALSGIKINGEDCPGFNSTTYSYAISLPLKTEKPAVIQATANDDIDIEITQPTAVDGTATIIAKLKDGSSKRTFYSLKFRETIPMGAPTDLEKKRIVKATASSDFPEKSIDGDSDDSSRFAAADKSWILYDLGTVKQVQAISLLLYNGFERNYNYSMEVSENGKSWKKVFDGQSNGTATNGVKDFETYYFKPTNARFVRINTNGSNANKWTGIIEIGIY